jgi:ribonuclease D
MKTLPDPTLVTQQKQLGDMIGLLCKQPIVAVDTESNSLFAYRERVCLIQFSIPSGDYVVDPLALNDLSPLGAVFASPAIEKVFHAAEYDLLVMKRDFGFCFANLFDTMVAARILGREKIGLGNLLEEEFGVWLEKKFQKRDWGKRPLPQAMLNYARMDTHYLIPLRDGLKNELRNVDRLDLAAEDFQRLSQLDGNGPTPQPANIWRMNGVRDLTPQQATILKLLAEYRRGRAEKSNKPLFKVIGDRTLLEIAARQPGSKKELEKIRGMTESQVRRHGKAILEAVRRGTESEPTYPPKRIRLDEDHLLRLEALKEWRKQAAQAMGVESDVVLPRDLMFEIAKKNPPDLKALSAIMDGTPWRLEHFGSNIQAVLTDGWRG